VEAAAEFCEDKQRCIDQTTLDFSKALISYFSNNMNTLVDNLTFSTKILLVAILFVLLKFFSTSPSKQEMQKSSGLGSILCCDTMSHTLKPVTAHNLNLTMQAPQFKQ